MARYQVKIRRCPSAAGVNSYSANNASIYLVSFLSLFCIFFLLFSVSIKPSLNPLLNSEANILMTKDDHHRRKFDRLQCDISIS